MQAGGVIIEREKIKKKDNKRTLVNIGSEFAVTVIMPAIYIDLASH